MLFYRWSSRTRRIAFPPFYQGARKLMLFAVGYLVFKEHWKLSLLLCQKLPGRANWVRIEFITLSSSPSNATLSFSKRVVCSEVKTFRSERNQVAIRIPPWGPNKVSIGYLQDRQTISFRIVRSQTPNLFARLLVVSNRTPHKYSQIACLRSEGPKLLTSQPCSVVRRIK